MTQFGATSSIQTELLKALKGIGLATLTCISIGSLSGAGAQPTNKPNIPDTPASCGCIQAVLAAGYTMEDDDHLEHAQMHSPSKPDDDKDDKDDKNDNDDKNDKADKNDRDDKDDKNDKDDHDDDKIAASGQQAASNPQTTRPALSGLLIYEAKKDGIDYDVYVDPKTCQIRAALRDE